MTFELKSCPFCAKPLTVRNGVNPYGRCDTEGCWMAEAKIGISCDDPKQVERWNTRPAPAATDTGLETVGTAAKFGQMTRAVFNAATVPVGSAVCLRSQAEELLAAKEAQTDAYGLALMMIREGCGNPSEIARKALARFGK